MITRKIVGVWPNTYIHIYIAEKGGSTTLLATYGNKFAVVRFCTYPFVRQCDPCPMLISRDLFGTFECLKSL